MQTRNIPNMHTQVISVDPDASALEGLTFDAAASSVRFPEGTKAVEVTSDPAAIGTP